MVAPPGAPAPARRVATSLVVAVLVAGGLVACTATSSVTGPPASATGAATRSPAASAAPSATDAAATASASAPASAAVSASASSVAPGSDAPLEPPPDATLVAGDDEHPGEVGSWTWAGGVSDAPWLPAQALEPVEVAAGSVTVGLAAGVEIESWTAVAATADDTQGLDLESLGNGSGPPSFRLREGDWVVAVDVRFADGLGSAIYYWHLVVT